MPSAHPCLPNTEVHSLDRPSQSTAKVFVGPSFIQQRWTCHTDTVYRLLRKHPDLLPAMRINGRLRVALDDIERFEKQCRTAVA